MLENPFKPITPEEDTDPAANANIVGTFLGSEAQAAYEKLNQGQEGKKGDDLSDLKLTDTEKAVVKEVREKEVWDRAHYIRWAESFGKDEEWVEKTFTFNDDGSVECGYLDLKYITKLHEFPQNLKRSGTLDIRNLTSSEALTLPEKIGGYLVLTNLISAHGLTLPKRVGGDLHLERLTSTEGLTLPEEIGGFLDLRSLTSVDGLIIPENFHVGCDVYTNRTLRPFFEKLKEEGKIGGEIIVVR